MVKSVMHFRAVRVGSRRYYTPRYPDLKERSVVGRVSSDLLGTMDVSIQFRLL